MTQTSITALERALEIADLVDVCKLVVVDNSSSEPFSSHTFSTKIPTQIARLDKNHSFSAASNFGARKVSSSQLFLFLNNDVFLHPEAISTMLDDKKRLNASICGARLVYPNGLLQHAGVEFANANEIIPRHVYHFEPSGKIPRVTSYKQAITGAVMLIDAEIFWKLRGFDEAFPFAYEDTDFCLRAAEIGSTTICSQTVDSIHLSGQSRNETTKVFENQSKGIFQDRWGGRVTSLNYGEVSRK